MEPIITVHTVAASLNFLLSSDESKCFALSGHYNELLISLQAPTQAHPHVHLLNTFSFFFIACHVSTKVWDEAWQMALSPNTRRKKSNQISKYFT